MKELKTRDIERSGLGFAPSAAPGIVFVHSPDESLRDRSLAVDGPLLIGRPGMEGVDLALDDTGVSRRHAIVRPRADGSGLEIEERGSRNGTLVNGHACRSKKLVAGDLVRVGDTIFAVESLAEPDALVSTDDAIVARSAAFRSAVACVDAAAATDLPVLLLGESGTGKEILAQRVHAMSGRSGSIVAVSCAAIPRELVEASLFGHRRGAFTGASADALGYFAQAENGTLFLDEIGELPLELQAKLLRVLETHEFAPVGSSVQRKCNVRIITATNADLRRCVERGSFRSDLYARIAGVIVVLPPLRERRSDILPLARHFLRTIAPDWKVEWTASFAERLCIHAWPMNVRELRTLVRRLAMGPDRPSVLHASELGRWLEELPLERDNADEAGTGHPSRDELVDLLRKHNGRVAAIAAHCGKDRRQVYRWLSRADLDPLDYKE